jgi:hydrogenase maturation protein HypF
MSASSTATLGYRRTRARVRGTVQGVGFRPYVYRLAGELELSGFVFNDARGVLLEVEGPELVVERFLARLAPDAPVLAVVEEVVTEELPTTGAGGFTIRESLRGEVADAPVAPDTATCEECLTELFDPADRRFRYPFINCTNCGPRFTIVRGVPYDRGLTTMSSFAMCELCAAEYEDPGNRRFHAQPNACPECGPAVALVDTSGDELAQRGARDAVAAAARALREGRIVAVKGIGGFHLACRADDEHAVATLRARKHREDKPFALMAASAGAARALVALGAKEGDLLVRPERPIVLAPRLPGAPVAAAVAPGAPELGVMLAYSPLHHLLLDDAGTALVMTSANVSDEPIAYRDEDALERLRGLADLFLLHDRAIQTRTDDSVLRVVAVAGRTRTSVLRRSRGYVPRALALPVDTPAPLLACGGQLKNTFCLAKGRRAWVSHHIGDLENYATLRSFVEGIGAFQQVFDVVPEVVVHDLHPEYLSTKFALELEGVELIGVQHHHAHLAACLAEHGEMGDAVGAIFDGSGYGSDATIWGGEFLNGNIADSRRAGMLLPVRLPGGAQAVRQPWRMACSWLAETGEARMPASLAGRVNDRAWEQIQALIRSGLGSPVTTSMGRLFDAVAALCGLRTEVNYEGQAAVELEAACDPREQGCYPIGVRSQAEPLLLDPRETISAIVADLDAGICAGVIASRFHAAIAAGTVTACSELASRSGTDVVVLSGGVFQNRRLLEAVGHGLALAGLRVLTPELLPANDGGISYGQAAVCARRLAS